MAEEGKTANVFREDKRAGNPYRQNFVDGTERLIAARLNALAAERTARMSPAALAADREGYRRQFVEMLGWPLTEYAPGRPVSCRCTPVEERARQTLYRLELEVLPDLWFYGLLFVPKAPGAHPLIIAQHGGGGSPELCSDLNGNNNYRHMTLRAVERDAVVFAPQLFLWCATDVDGACFPGYGVQYNRGHIDMRLRQAGGCVTAFELFCLRRSLDYLLAQPFVDGRTGMIGLSYGGLYTILLPAVEPRIKSAYSCSYFSGPTVYRAFPDMLWQGAAEKFMNAEIAALIAPRALYIEVGQNDTTILPLGAREEYQRLAPYYEAQGAADSLVFRMTEENHRIQYTDDGYDFLFAHLND